MKIDGQPYEVTIIGIDGKPIQENEDGYAPLADGERYKIMLRCNTLDAGCLGLGGLYSY